MCSFFKYCWDLQAGKVSGNPNEDVAGCMRQYTADDGISAMKHELGRFKEPHDSVFDVMPRLVSKRHPGIYNEVTGHFRCKKLFYKIVLLV